ncbi:MAG: T9SS type A sorting domain-containing protein [Saprospiraceae bacterium]|nr:T9SS type A sorting domain-containing protein [Saprospiraceae bacterium]
MNLKCTILLLPIFLTIQIFGQTCPAPSAIIEFEGNNVRSKLSHGGSLWWDKRNGRFAVPKQSLRAHDVHAFHVAGIWVGGKDPGGNPKFAGATYGQSSGLVDFWAGPLNTLTGRTDPSICANWDRFFRVEKADVDLHTFYVQKSRLGTLNYTADLIPPSIKQWPANGNPYFESENGFGLPDNNYSFTDFYDENQNGIYEPLDGDYPAIYFSECRNYVVPAKMIYWVFNDFGGYHQETNGDPIQAEFHALAFAFNTGTDLDYSQFYRYKMINRATEDLEGARIGLWTDPELGCYNDDFFGCDTSRSLMYIYNEDAIDGLNGTFCPGGINTFGEEIPMVGIDFLGVKTKNRLESIKPMEVFGFYDSNSFYYPAPQNTSGYYNLLNGLLSNGQAMLTPFGDTTTFAFPSPPDCNDPTCWSMCKNDPGTEDPKTIMSTGKFDLSIGKEIELFFANIFAPKQSHPCPNLEDIRKADDFVQAVFDNCFRGVTSSIPNLDIKYSTLVYPNPISIANGNLVVKGLSKGDKLRIVDLQGQVHMDRIVTDFGDQHLNLPENISPGMYFLQVNIKGLQTRTTKIIVTD